MEKIFLDRDKIRSILLKRFWTFKVLAEKSGVTYPTICAALRQGGTPVKMSTLQKICSALESDASAIVRG